MGRFERQDNEAGNLPGTLGTATEDLRTTIESEVTKIVSRAQARAAEIEDQALEKASRVERESERRARDVFESSRERVTQMLAEIDEIERAIGEAVRSLRSEAERLTSELSTATSEPFEAIVAPEPPPEPPEIPEPAEPVAAETDGGAPAAEPEEAAPGPVTPHLQSNDAAPPEAGDDDVREMIRQQLMTLAEGGRNRADAERMLLRFRQGEQYFDLLDEIYPDQTPSRRGLLRRRKAH